MTVKVIFFVGLAVIEAESKSLLHDVALVLLNSVPDFIVSIYGYGDIVHHLKGLLLTDLLYLGDQLSGQSLVNEIVVEGCVQDGEHIVFHGYCKAFFGADPYIHKVSGYLSGLSVNVQSDLAVSFKSLYCPGRVSLCKSGSESLYL